MHNINCKMESLSDEIVNKIMLYNSHPCADMIRKRRSFRYNGKVRVRLVGDAEQDWTNKFNIQQTLRASPQHDLLYIMGNCSHDWWSSRLLVARLGNFNTTLKELKDMCRENKIRGFSKLKRQGLIQTLTKL